MGKWLLRLFICSGALVISLGAAATEIPLNMKDKRDVHEIIVSGRLVGKVEISTRFAGEPVAFPVRIQVRVRCEPGFTQREFDRPRIWQAYDYGTRAEPSRLSTYDRVNHELVVHYWVSRMDPERGAIHDRQRSRRFSLSQACLSK